MLDSMVVIIIVYIILVFVIFKIIFKFGSPIIKGKVGEDRIEKFIKKYDANSKVLRNLYIPINSHDTTEIDLLWITTKGIIVIESKNYNGWIFGNEKSKYWMQIIYNNKQKFYNPVVQNRIHIDSIKKIVNLNTKCFSIVIFSNNCTLKDITINSKDTYVMQFAEFKNTINLINSSNDDIFNDISINEIYLKLVKFEKKNLEASIIMKHDNYIKAKK